MKNLTLAVGIVLMLALTLASQARADGVSDFRKMIDELNVRVDELEDSKESDTTFRAYWKEGFRFDSADGAFKMKLGGRIMNDWAWFDADDDLETAVGKDFEDGTEFRRARLYVSGTVYDNVEFKAQYDFAGGDADFKDVYIGLKKLPFGGIRVGHFKEPFSLEELTSSKYITFMERAMLNDAFVPSRNTGIMLHDKALDGRITWAAGVFRDSDGYGEDSGDEYSVTGRITGVPWQEDGGKKLLHLGVAASYRDAEDENGENFRFRARPEAHLASSRLVDTGNVAADDMNLFGVEAALVYGPFSLQSEYMAAQVNGRDGAGDPDLGGFYVAASYFLTGENRKYKGNTFSRVKPKNNFLGEERGPGAWELAARYSMVDLHDTDEGATGGELEDYTIGLNWYLNPNVRVMFNYVFADPDKKYEDDMNIFQTRVQIDF